MASRDERVEVGERPGESSRPPDQSRPRPGRQAVGHHRPGTEDRVQPTAYCHSLPGRLTAPVLVLNLNYVPVNVCTVRRAIVLVAKGKAELLERRAESERIRTFSATLNAPSIIRLVYLVKRPFAPRRLSKKEVFLRDRYTCQYCGQRSQHLTLDHVVPRRQHGPHTWDNVVAACERCNLDKAGRTPEEANMKLRRIPAAPQPNPYRILENRAIRDEWRRIFRGRPPAAPAMATTASRNGSRRQRRLRTDRLRIGRFDIYRHSGLCRSDDLMAKSPEKKRYRYCGHPPQLAWNLLGLLRLTDSAYPSIRTSAL